MNTHLTGALAQCHSHELRQQAAQHRRAACRGGRAPLPRAHRPGLRSRLGFTLLSAGLRLVASAPHTAE